MTVENYDFFCVDFAKRLVDDVSVDINKNIFSSGEVENSITKGLSVLYNNGLYAFLLYMVWKKNTGTRVERRVYGLVDQYLVGETGASSLLRIKEMNLPLAEAKDPLEAGKTLSQNFDNLLFAKELLGRTLAYARYQTKGL